LNDDDADIDDPDYGTAKYLPLAKLARAQRLRQRRNQSTMDACERREFDLLVADAEEFWNGRSRERSNNARIAKTRRMGKDAESLCRQLGGLLADTELLIALENARRENLKRRRRLAVAAAMSRRAGRNRIGTRERALPHGDRTVSSLRYDLIDALRSWRILCEVAVEQRLLPQPQRGAPSSDGSFEVAVYLLARAWKLGSGREAGTSTKSGDANSRSGNPKRGGPFTDFVRSAFKIFDSSWKPGSAFGDKVRAALKIARRDLRQK